MSAERDGPGVASVAAACVLLTLVFVALGFPYDLLGARIAREIANASGLQLRGSVASPYLSLRGPGIEWRDLEIEGPEGGTLPAERLRIRPAWSLAWLRLEPALHLELVSDSGRIQGVATLGKPETFGGEIVEWNLARLPAGTLWPDAVVDGRLDAVVDLRSGRSAPQGSVQLTARNGSIAVPGVSLAIPYDSLEGELLFGGDGSVQISGLQAQGTLLRARASGRIAAAQQLAHAPLDVVLEVEAQPRFRETLRQLGVRTARGKAKLKLQGTPSAPRVR